MTPAPSRPASTDPGAPVASVPSRDDATGAGPSSDGWTQRFWPILAVIAVAAVAVRIAAILLLPHRTGLPGGDGFYYAYSSEALFRTGEFGLPAPDGTVAPDVLHPPLWTVFLAVVRAGGASTLDHLRIAAASLGVLTVVLVGLAGRRLLSERTGLVAAALVAVSPAFWTYERNLNAEAIAFPLMAASILLAYRYRDHPTLARYVALSAVLGVLALARTEQVIVGALLLLALAIGTPALGLTGRLARVALGGLVMLVILSPWTVFNLSRFEHPVLLSSGSGNAMLAGACDTVFTGPLIGGYDPNCNLKNPKVLPIRDRTVRDEIQRAEAIEYSLDHAGQLPAVVAAREGRAWGFFDITGQNEIHAVALDLEPSWVMLQTVVFWILAPTAVVGAVLLRRRGIAVYPLLLFPAVALISVAITFGDIRYRASAEIPVVLLAAAAVDLLLPARRRDPAAAAIRPGSD